jgi:SAM-dependent methyltransferase
MLKKIIRVVRKEGIPSLLRAAATKILGSKPLKGFNELRTCLEDKQGLEIGGPSKIFMGKSILPIYGIVGSCDNCNFATETVWQRGAREGLEFKYHPKKPPGYQFICEASNLAGVPDAKYDFVISSHVIEHLANPLKAILEWKRVLRMGGVMLVVCPHKERTFDHGRPVTPLSHLIDDYNKGVDEHDLTHLPEILKLHDLSLDPEAGSFETFQVRSKNNFANRCLHHHVFTTESWISIFDYLKFETFCLEEAPPCHIIAVGKKVNENAENSST